MTNSFDGQPAPAAVDEPAPLVDEALAATASQSDSSGEIQALRAEVTRLQEAVAGTAAGASRLVSAELRGKVQSQPLVAAAGVAIVAFLYGASR